MSKTLKVRVSDVEEMEWKQRAEEAGESLSEWIRGRCNEEVPSGPLTKEDGEEWKEILQRPLQEKSMTQPSPSLPGTGGCDPKKSLRGSVKDLFADKVLRRLEIGDLCSRCGRIGVASCEECLKRLELDHGTIWSGEE